MAIKKDSGRQYPLVARVSFTYLDLGTPVTASTILEAIDLPAGAIVIGGYLNVTTAWVGPTAATIDVGSGADPDRYSASPLNLLAAGRTALTLTGYVHPGQEPVEVDLVQTVAISSAGAGELVIEYVLENRTNENQG